MNISLMFVKKFDLNPTEIVASWKEKFGTYAKFKEYLEDNKYE